MRIDTRTQQRRQKKKSLWRRLSAQPRRLSATATKEHDWGADVPSIKLSTAFVVMLMLHVVVVGGALLFHMLDRDGDAAESTSGREVAASVSSGAEAREQGTEVRAGGESVAMEDLDETELTRHIVRPRESISSIAANYQVDPGKLMALNKVGEGNDFRVGMPLLIPPREFRAERPGSESIVRIEAARLVDEPGSAAPAATTSTAATTGASGEVEHTVQPGETLWAISQQYDASQSEIEKANSIDDPTRLQVGQKLRIPTSNNH